MKALELFEVSKDKVHFVRFIKVREPKTRKTVYLCYGMKTTETGKCSNYVYMFSLYPYQPGREKKRYTRDEIIALALEQAPDYLKKI